MEIDLVAFVNMLLSKARLKEADELVRMINKCRESRSRFRYVVVGYGLDCLGLGGIGVILSRLLVSRCAWRRSRRCLPVGQRYEIA